MFFEQNGFVPDWVGFIREAIHKGWNLESLRSKIESATSDVYGPVVSQEILKRYDQVIATQE